jgi:hypothetical protein
VIAEDDPDLLVDEVEGAGHAVDLGAGLLGGGYRAGQAGLRGLGIERLTFREGAGFKRSKVIVSGLLLALGLFVTRTCVACLLAQLHLPLVEVTQLACRS